MHGETVAVIRAAPDADPAAVAALARALAVAAETSADRTDVAREALERYRELNLLYRVATSIGGSLDPAAIAESVLAEAARVVRSDAAVVVPAAGSATPAASRGAPDAVEALSAEAASLAGTVIASGSPDIAAPGDAGPFSGVLAVPLPGRTSVLGAVILARVPGRPTFTAGDEKLMVALADQAAVALERAWLHRADAQRQRMEQELVVARRIQRDLLPRTLPQPPGWSVAGLYEPAREVGGDIYDAFRLPDSTALSLLVADVTGKGVPAALVMATARALLRAEACAGRPPAEVLDATNRALIVGQASPLFLSAVHAVLDVGSARLRYASAGHEPPVLVRASGEAVLLPAAGVVLGAFERVDVHESTVELEPGDIVAFYTDGVTEARDGTRAMFGEERLLEALAAARRLPAEGVVGAVRAALASFTGETPAFDDVTLLVVKRELP